jgi:hypothetical protein
MKVKVINIISIVSIVLLVIAFAQNPYSYYITLRWLITILTLVTLVIAFQEEYTLILYLNAAIPIIYNPIFPIHLTRGIWEVINIITIIILILNIVFITRK